MGIFVVGARGIPNQYLVISPNRRQVREWARNRYNVKDLRGIVRIEEVPDDLFNYYKELVHHRVIVLKKTGGVMQDAGTSKTIDKN